MHGFFINLTIGLKADRSFLLRKICPRGFDAAPDYDLGTLRFAVQNERKSAYDDLGTSAMAGVENTIDALENAALSAIWKEVKENAN